MAKKKAAAKKAATPKPAPEAAPETQDSPAPEANDAPAPQEATEKKDPRAGMVVMIKPDLRGTQREHGTAGVLIERGGECLVPMADVGTRQQEGYILKK